MREINPAETGRAAAFALWMQAPMPMVTICKTLDVARLLRISRRHSLKFNMLLCWCIGRAAAAMEVFYLLPVGDKLIQYDKIAVNTVVSTKDGGISTCDIPFSESLRDFNRDYLRLTEQVCRTCAPYDLGGDCMVIGTSALPQTEIDGAVNIYAGCYNNPFLIWGRYRRGLFRTALPLSFQFHHTQMDGGHAAQFLESLQREIRKICCKPTLKGGILP